MARKGNTEASNEMVVEKTRVETLSEEVAKVLPTVEGKISDANKAIGKKDLNAYMDALAQANKAVSSLNDLIAKVEYAKFASEENPMIAAVKAFYYDAYKVTEVKDKETNRTTSVKLDKKKTRIDLKKFCDEEHLPTEWVGDSAQLLALLTLREVDVFKMSATKLASMSYYFIAAATAKKNKETPDSNTQIVKLIQKIIDEAIFVDDGTGKNAYKCTNHDIAFIHDAVTKMDTKEKCTIGMLNDRQFRMVMASVFAHCLGSEYKVAVTKKKQDA